MKLTRLEVKNYRSIKGTIPDKSQEFEKVELAGLDCLIGKNNAGKSNILHAIRFLLKDENRVSEEMYYGRDEDLTIEVKGFFKIEDTDFERLKIPEKRENMRELTLEDNTIGIYRKSGNKNIKVMRPIPKESRLKPDEFKQFHKEAWDELSGADFRDNMSEEYPELEEFLTEGKETNKGQWSDAYDEFLSNLPENIETTLEPSPPPQGLDVDLLGNFLPQIIYIPPVKEITDATKTSRRAEFGRLIQELGSEIEEELNGLIDEAMEVVHKELNVVTEEGEEIDNRHKGVQEIEKTISGYVQETFDDHSVDLRFPNPESISIIKNAEIWVEEKGFGEHEVEHQGEGVKRVLIFSLIRTLADLRQGKIEVITDDSGDEPRQPMLILFEEAELFLHPRLQQVMLKAFRDLVDNRDQVVFSTHSPFLVSDDLLDTVNIVEKTPDNGTKSTNFYSSKIEDLSEKERLELLEIEKISSYLFADKVLLVEGKSDKIVLRKLAIYLDESWGFQKNGIPIIPVYSKHRLPLFKKALNSLGIDVYVVTDRDIIFDGFTDLFEEQELLEEREELINTVNEKAQELEDEAISINRDTMEKISSKYDWKDVFQQFYDLQDRLKSGKEATEEDIACLQRFVDFKKEKAERKVMEEDDSLNPDKKSLIKNALTKNVLILNGDLEDYFPDEFLNKIRSAIEFEPKDHSRDEIKAYFQELELSNNKVTDVEQFFSNLFS